MSTDDDFDHRNWCYQETDANDAQRGRVVVLPESGKIGAIIEILIGTEPVVASLKLMNGDQVTHEFFTLLEADVEQHKQFYHV